MQRLKLFGGVSIETDAGPLVGRAVQRRRLALLALLATARARPTSRDRLAALLWPDADPENGRRFLSDSVYRINQALGGDAIVAAGDGLRLDPQRLPSDVGEFEEAVAAGDHALAARLHGGPFLEGFALPDSAEYERWIEVERERLTRAAAAAVEALAEAAEREGRHAEAVSGWRRLATADPFNSRIALRLMKALELAGERAAALQYARIHETLLREELELEPDAAVRQYAERLRREGASGSEAGGGVLVRAPAAPPAYLPAPAAPPDPAPPVATPVEATPPPPPPAPPAPRAPRLWVRWLAAAAVVLVLALSVRTWTAGRGDRSAASPAPGTIAVLPFANLSGDRADEYFSDGITEELIATLARVEGMQVASRSSVFAYKGRSDDVREVARRLGVAAVLEGSVRRSGRTLRITAQLVSAETGYDLWSESFDREHADVFAIQEEIAGAIVRRLRGGAPTSRAVPLAEQSTRDAEAYDLYLRGRHAWHRRTRQGLIDARDYFGRAVARAPAFARAYVGLADAYAVSAFYDHLDPREAYPAAERAAARALALDSSLAAAHATFGYLRTYYRLDWPAAERSFQRAIALDPGYSTAPQWYGNLLTVAGRYDEAERAFRAAQEADPLSLVAIAGLAWVYHYAGRWDDAVAQAERAVALNPAFELAHLWGGMALERAGRRREARAWLGRADSLSGGTALTQLSLAQLLASDPAPAVRDSARAIVRGFEARRARGEYVPAFEIAKVHLALGDRPAALRWLARAVDDRSHSRAFLRTDPQLAALRGDAEFERLIGGAFGAR